MSDINANLPKNEIAEKGLEKMEALLRQSANGFHVLFDNRTIAKAMTANQDPKAALDFDKMKKIQDLMTDLIAKPTYYEKMAFLQELDPESHEMLIRTYFHIVENTVRASTHLHH